MKPLQSKDIFGNWATLLLPVKENDEIDFAKLDDEIDVLISMHVNGIYSNGTAGEFYNQTEDEFDAISRMLFEKCSAADIPFQIGCSHSDPEISLARLRRAKTWHPSAVQIILPDWSPLSMDEIIVYLKRLEASAAPVGLVLYNPPHAKRRLVPEDFYQIKKAGIELVGCKVGGGDKNWYAKMKQFVPDLSLFIPGHYLATGISLGANGAYSNVACLHPGAAQSWYELMKDDMDAALEMEDRIQGFMKLCILPFILEKGFSNQAVDKFMAVVGGWANIETRLRWPYKSIPPRYVESVRKTAEHMLPEFFKT